VCLTRLSDLLKKISSLWKECDSHKILGSATKTSSFRKECESHKTLGSATIISSLRQKCDSHKILGSATKISSLWQECESNTFLRMSWKVQACDSTMILTRFSDCNEMFKHACTRHSTCHRLLFLESFVPKVVFLQVASKCFVNLKGFSGWCIVARWLNAIGRHASLLFPCHAFMEVKESV
jgi:hypothetical protein